MPAAAPRVDPFQEQLKREAEQLTQRKQVESAAQELAQVKASQAAAARNKGLASYLGKIRDKIRGNIALPPDIKGNPEAVFEVTQLPSGEVIVGNFGGQRMFDYRALGDPVNTAAAAGPR